MKVIAKSHGGIVQVTNSAVNKHLRSISGWYHNDAQQKYRFIQKNNTTGNSSGGIVFFVR